MSHCGKCKHWRRFDRKDSWGSCRRLHNADGRLIKVYGGWADHVTPSRVWETHERFGCVHWVGLDSGGRG